MKISNKRQILNLGYLCGPLNSPNDMSNAFRKFKLKIVCPIFLIKNFNSNFRQVLKTDL